MLQERYIQGVQSMCCRNDIHRVFNLCVAGTIYTGCSIYVLQERYIQGVQFVRCRNDIYRVFNLCVAGTYNTGCSIYVLQERYIQGVQFKYDMWCRVSYIRLHTWSGHLVRAFAAG
jgi:hypothetical protein